MKCTRCENRLKATNIGGRTFLVDQFGSPECEPDRLHLTTNVGTQKFVRAGK